MFHFYCRHLRYLNLSYNLIERIENLDDLHIQELHLECNCITSFKSAIPDRGLSILPDLRRIILAHNRLSTLQFFKVIVETESYLKLCGSIVLSRVHRIAFSERVQLTLRGSKIQQNQRFAANLESGRFNIRSRS